MNHFEILFFGLAAAFVWTKVLQWGKVKPFNCLPCMTGWFSFALSLLFGMWIISPLFLIAGVFIGAMFESILMRYL